MSIVHWQLNEVFGLLAWLTWRLSVFFHQLDAQHPRHVGLARHVVLLSDNDRGGGVVLHTTGFPRTGLDQRLQVLRVSTDAAAGGAVEQPDLVGNVALKVVHVLGHVDEGLSALFAKGGRLVRGRQGCRRLGMGREGWVGWRDHVARHCWTLSARNSLLMQCTHFSLSTFGEAQKKTIRSSWSLGKNEHTISLIEQKLVPAKREEDIWKTDQLFKRTELPRDFWDLYSSANTMDYGYEDKSIFD